MNSLHRSIIVGLLCTASALCLGQVRVSGSGQAGADATLQISGSGSTTLYLFGPGGASKRTVQRGTVTIPGDELKVAGRYVAVLDDSRTSFFVSAAPLQKISFITHPSRVPAAANGAVLGSAYLFDRYQNLVLAPTPVSFQLGVAGSAVEERKVIGKNGVAWVQLNSGRRSGPAQFIASSGEVSVRRVVQHVAADPCNIRMNASRAPDGNILVETDAIRDCSGNAVPDGTIVTFTSVDSAGRSTVDARIKRGFARAELPASSSATLSVAAGVVLGNEIHWGGGL
ncbi:MAG TPA: hypothetical protein VM578_03185 [Candidatus Saccharimonadales bacterium]|nr:hypothetical protein [Candidatus Saccharimonadales bacterium]